MAVSTMPAQMRLADDKACMAENEAYQNHPYSKLNFESAPPGWEPTVKAMKKHPEIDNPFALAWYMDSQGYTSHK